MDTLSYDIAVEVGPQVGDFRRLIGTVEKLTDPGMYLVATITFMARTRDGRFLTGHTGNPFIPLQPRVGFCADHNVCDVTALEHSFTYADLAVP
jgi:hypothetical protein